MSEPATVAAAPPEAPTRPAAERVLLVALLIVAVAAGIAGVVMLVIPGNTDDYFAWALAPEPLAAIVGGLYVASAIVFGAAAATRWPAGRGLCAGALALTLPTLAATIAHRDVFDFSRALAVIWVILFVASPLTFAAILVALRREGGPSGPLPPGWLRAGLAVLALAYLAGAIAFLADPTTFPAPFDMPPMGGRFLGAWCLLLAVMAAWPALRGRREARIPLLALVALPAGALVGALRSAGDMEAGSARAAWIAVLAALTVIGAAALALARPGRERPGAGR
jgi:hypothetical protein